MGLRGPKGEIVTNLSLAFKTRPKPPRGFPKIAKDCWKRIIQSLPPDHFRDAELPLLEKYCMAEELYQRSLTLVLERGTTQVTPQGIEIPSVHLRNMENQRRDMNALATKLRITTNSRISKHKAAGEKEEPASRRRDLMFGGKK